MKRLMNKRATSLLKAFKRKRMMRFAEWVDKEVTDPNLVQDITNVMSTGGQIQIMYTDGGWRTISPYGWNSSKEGNVLIMCYKDTGELRSYRLDRVQLVKIDSDALSPEDELIGEEFDTLENSEFDLPLETNDTEVDKDLPFDDAIDMLDAPAPPEETALEEMNVEQPPNEQEKKDEELVDVKQ